MELGLISHVRDQVRTLLNIRQEREVPPAGHKPPFGAKVFCVDVRMTVLSGMTDTLWHWLIKQGWREVRARPDRRHYKDIPTAYVTRLIDSEDDDDRTRVLEAAIANAAYRPRMTRAGRIVPAAKNK